MLRLLAFKLISRLRRLRWAFVGKMYRGDVRIHHSTHLHPSVVFRLWGGRIVIEERVLLDRNVGLHADGGSIRIGARSIINAGTVIIGGGEVEVGADVMVAPGCVLVASNHVFSRRDIPMALQGLSNGRVVVGNDVWLGAGVKIMSGVTVGQGAIVGAGAVVTADVEPYSIVAGIPARKIRMRP